MKFFTEEITVNESHLDYNRHVNNIEFIRWAQHVSGAHWEAVANEDMKKKYQWVIRRNEIDYFRQVYLGDQLTITTWIDSSEKATSVRVIEIFNRTRNELAAKAVIHWYLLNAETGKPMRISEEAKELFR